jgi:hypothetical protein
LYAPLLSPYVLHAPSHHPDSTAEQYTLSTFLLCSTVHSLVTLSHSGPNIFCRTLFLNTHSLLSSLNVGDQVLHQHRIIYGGCSSKEETTLKWRPETHPCI